MIIHDGDYDGPVAIYDLMGNKVVVGFDDLKAFVAAYVRDRMIASMEQANDDEILFWHWTVDNGGET